MSIKKVWDITQPQDEWERTYARMEYLRIGILRILSRRIYIQEKVLGDYYDAEPWELR